MHKAPKTSMNIAEAKKHLSEVVGRVAFAHTTVLITRRGVPMAKIVPIDEPTGPVHLAQVRGWLDGDDPFFHEVDEIARSRDTHTPRVLSGRSRKRRA